MNLTYQVPRELYIELLAEMIRRNDRRPLRMLIAALMTVGQMAVVILLCVFRLESGQRVFFLIWSVLLAGLTVLRRSTVKQRAGGSLRRLEYSGQLSEDYWREHRLRTVGQEIQLSYGAQRLSCPLFGITRVEEKPGALYLYCENTIFDIVPESAFPSREAMLEFAENIRGMAAQGELPRTEQPAKEPGFTDGVSWTMEERAFEEGQYLAFRKLYYRFRFLRPATFVRLAVSVVAMLNLVRELTPVNVTLSAVVLLLANLENLSMVPAVSRLRIRREVGAWHGSSAYRLALRGDTLLFAADRASVSIPINKINLCEEIGPYFAIAWNRFPAVILPREAGRGAETAALLKEIKTRYQNSLALRQGGTTL